MKSRGFTLIEIAVVMIVIGLLIGGVLKGMELYANSQVTSAISQADKIKKSFVAFQKAYYTYPGDLNNAGATLPNCTGVCNNNGDENRVVGAEIQLGTSFNGTVFNLALGAPNENMLAWAHLSATDMLKETAVDPQALEWGNSHPTSPGGGGFHVLFNANGLDEALGFSGGDIRTGHWLMQTKNLRARANDLTTGSGIWTAEQALRGDKKIDDGMPNAGSVVAYPVANCATGTGANATYGSTPNVNGGCNLVFFMFE